MHGMAHVRLTKALFRDPLPPHEPQRSGATRWRADAEVIPYHPVPQAAATQSQPQQQQQQQQQQVQQQRQPRFTSQSQSQHQPHTNHTQQQHGSAGLPTAAMPQQSSPHSSGPLSQQPPFIWTAATTPLEWTWAGSRGLGRPPERQSCCQVEADAAVDDIINRAEAVRVPLEQATPDMQLVDSLVTMWRDERARCGDVPPPPRSPTRRPKPLCAAVEAVRAEYRVRGAGVAALALC